MMNMEVTTSPHGIYPVMKMKIVIECSDKIKSLGSCSNSEDDSNTSWQIVQMHLIM